MSKSKTREDNLEISQDESFSEINWISLWQASGNDWFWMMGPEYSRDVQQLLAIEKPNHGPLLILAEIAFPLVLLFGSILL